MQASNRRRRILASRRQAGALHSLPLPFESHTSKKYRHPDGCLYFLADRVGFEPTSPLLDYLISSQSRYDHFDTAPYLSQHQHLRKRGELMGRTSKNIKLRIPEKPRKIKGFRTGSYRVATTISSVVRLWQIHGWSRSFQVALSRAGNPGTARNFGHSDPYLPEAI